jgi:hypothetical protein
MQMGLYITVSLLVAFIAFELGLGILGRLVGESTTVIECRNFIRVFVHAGYPGRKLYLRHKETGRVIKLKKLHLPFDFKGELTVELTVVIPSAYRLDQMESICEILKQYDPAAGMTRPGELLAHFPNDEELLARVARSILAEGFELGFGIQLKVSQFGPLSIKDLHKCDKL